MSEIKIPTSAEEARAMAALGFKWLEDNAPEQLTQHWRDMQAEAGRAGFIAGYHKMHIDFVGSLAPEESAGFAADHYAESIRSGSQP